MNSAISAPIGGSNDGELNHRELIGAGLVSYEPESRPPAKAHCLWCGRAFTPRVTGGSAQKFCCTAHRQTFWIAARRWTLLAIDAGLLSVECLKAIQASVHAVTPALRTINVSSKLRGPSQNQVGSA